MVIVGFDQYYVMLVENWFGILVGEVFFGKLLFITGIV